MVLNRAGGRCVWIHTPKMNRRREDPHVDDISEAELPTPKSLEERYVWVQRSVGFSQFLNHLITIESAIVMEFGCLPWYAMLMIYYRKFYNNELICEFWKFCEPLNSNIPFFKAFRSWKLSFGYVIDMVILSLPVHFRSIIWDPTTSSLI